MQETWDRFLVWEDPHAAEQLSPCATTTELALQSPGAASPEARTPQRLCSMTGEAPTARNLGPATIAQPPISEIREKSVQQQRPRNLPQPKIINKRIKSLKKKKKEICCYFVQTRSLRTSTLILLKLSGKVIWDKPTDSFISDIRHVTHTHSFSICIPGWLCGHTWRD